MLIIVVFFAYLAFNILCILINLVSTFLFWDAIKEGKIVIIIITIAYICYLIFCKSYLDKFQKDGYEYGIVIINYVILFPIAFYIYLVILLIIGFMCCMRVFTG